MDDKRDELAEIEAAVRHDLVGELGLGGRDPEPPAVTSYRLARRVLAEELALRRTGGLGDGQRAIQALYSVQAARKAWLECCDRLRRDYPKRVDDDDADGGEWTERLLKRPRPERGKS